MGVLTSETCWAVNWHKISDIKLVYLYSSIKMMHGPIRIRCLNNIFAGGGIGKSMWSNGIWSAKKGTSKTRLPDMPELLAVFHLQGWFTKCQQQGELRMWGTARFFFFCIKLRELTSAKNIILQTVHYCMYKRIFSCIIHWLKQCAPFFGL